VATYVLASLYSTTLITSGPYLLAPQYEVLVLRPRLDQLAAEAGGLGFAAVAKSSATSLARFLATDRLAVWYRPGVSFTVRWGDLPGVMIDLENAQHKVVPKESNSFTSNKREE